MLGCAAPGLGLVPYVGTEVWRWGRYSVVATLSSEKLVPGWRLSYSGTLTPGEEGGNSPAEGWGGELGH